MKPTKPVALALVAALGVAGAMTIASAQSPAPTSPPMAGQPPAGGPGAGPWGWGDGPGWGMGRHWGMDGGWGRHRMSKEDRAAFLNARIASIHAGLNLTADQEKLWPAVESAVRDMANAMVARFDQARADRPKDPIEGMKRRAEWQIARGEAMKKVADAAAPLYASLTPDQKERLPMLVRPGMRGHMGRWMHDHGIRWGWGRDDDRG